MEAQTYFRDESDSDIQGIVVVEKDHDDVRVTENRGSEWCAPFWMEGWEFQRSVVKSTERVGELPDEKFAQVMSMANSNI